MAGTITGGKKAAATNKQKHGMEYYSNIGKLGGQASTTGGFAQDRERASRAGKLGGSISRRGPKKAPTEPIPVKGQARDAHGRFVKPINDNWVEHYLNAQASEPTPTEDATKGHMAYPVVVGLYLAVFYALYTVGYWTLHRYWLA